MPALFAYLLAVSLLLGGGYVSLHWLAAPPDASTNQRPSAGKGVSARNDAVKKSDPSAAAETQAEKRPNDQTGTETAASPLTSGASSKAVPQAPAKQTGESEDTNAQTKKAEDVPAGGCMPFGLTAKGQLVFPIECQALLERHRARAESQPSVPASPTQSAPAPKEAQAAEPAKLAGDKNADDKNTDLNRNESSPNKEATAKVADVAPSGEAKPGEPKPGEPKPGEIKSGEIKPGEAKSGKENPEPEAANGKRPGKRSMQSARSKPVMMILRTIEFPDGHREQRLLPLGHSRRAAFPSEEDWFDPLTFR
jgi:hypothetical protein